MHKLRLTVRIATGVLVVLAMTGIILLIANRKLDFLDTTYEAIAFLVGMAGMIMAVASQIDSYGQEKATRKMIDELTALNREHDDDEKVDNEFQQELEKLLAQNREIERELRKEKKRK